MSAPIRHVTTVAVFVVGQSDRALAGPSSVSERLARYLRYVVDRRSVGATINNILVAEVSTPYHQLFTTLMPGQQLPTEPLRHLRQAAREGHGGLKQ